MRKSVNAASTERKLEPGTEQLVRTTVFLPSVLDENLTLFAFREKMSKAEVVREATKKYLKDKDLEPDKKPKVKLQIEY